MIPLWLENLEEEEWEFIRKFILSSGSLKEMAGIYGVTYPTMRLRLDLLIEKIRLQEKEESDDYVLFIKRLALNDKLDFDTAKILIDNYRKEK